MHVHGQTWYVGTCGITVVLVNTKAGLALFDSGPKEAAPLVLANVRALGFDPTRIKWIFSTHEHFDHGGGIAVLEKVTGARLAAGPFAAGALSTGKPYPDDPQFTLLTTMMLPARVDRVLADGGAVTLGGKAFTAHSTPAHSPGSTSWTWRSCEQGKCLTIALADSVNVVSADEYRFTDHPARVASMRAGLDKVSALPCDIILSPHPSKVNNFARLSGKAALVDADACKTYSAAGLAQLEKRLVKEKPGK